MLDPVRYEFCAVENSKYLPNDVSTLPSEPIGKRKIRDLGYITLLWLILFFPDALR